MSDAHGDRIPRPAIAAAAGLLVVTILAAAGARLTGVGTVEVPASEPVDSRELVFEDAADGSVVVRDPLDGEVLYVVEPGTNGFLRGVLRGLARERKLRGVGPEPAFVLTRWADGRLTLEDPQTERRLYLGPFGSGNVKIFVTLLQAGPAGTARTAANAAATQR